MHAVDVPEELGQTSKARAKAAAAAAAAALLMALMASPSQPRRTRLDATERRCKIAESGWVVLSPVFTTTSWPSSGRLSGGASQAQHLLEGVHVCMARALLV
jgi:hypothetical protein